MIKSESTYISSTSPTTENVVTGDRDIGCNVHTTEISVTSSNKRKATNDTSTVTSSSSHLPFVTGPVKPVSITHTIEIVMTNETYFSSTQNKCGHVYLKQNSRRNTRQYKLKEKYQVVF